MLSDLGVTLGRRMATPTHTRLSQSASRRASLDSEEVTTRCEVTKKICYLSLVSTKNLLSLTGKYKNLLSLTGNQKICYLSPISTKNMLPLTGKSKILLTLASKYINIFYLSLISIKKTVISFWEVPKNLFVLTGRYEKKMLTLLVSNPPLKKTTCNFSMVPVSG